MKNTGQIRNWNEDKGFGFVYISYRTDAFIHISQLPFRDDIADRWIKFDTEETSKGIRAINIECYKEGRKQDLIKLQQEEDAREKIYQENVLKFPKILSEFINTVDLNDIKYSKKIESFIDKMYDEEWNDIFNLPVSYVSGGRYDNDFDEDFEDEYKEKAPIEWITLVNANQKLRKIIWDKKQDKLIRDAKAATHLKCSCCDEMLPKESFDVEDYPTRDNRAYKSNICIDREEKAYEEMLIMKRGQIVVLALKLENKTITKKELKDLARLCMKGYYRQSISELEGHEGKVMRHLIKYAEVRNFWASGRDSYGDFWISGGKLFTRGGRTSNKGRYFSYSTVVGLLKYIDSKFNEIVEEYNN